MGGMGGGAGGFPGGMPGGGGGHRQSPPQHDIIPSGTPVVVHGLKSQPAKNGATGKIRGFDGSKGRYTVELDGSQEELALRPSNIQQQVDGCKLTGIASKPEWNGQKGKVVGYDEGKSRYHIQLSGSSSSGSVGSVASLSPSNIILPTNTRVKVDGLTSAKGSAMNGRMGQITSYDASAERYVVQIGPQESMKLKLDNVIA
jgi:hypothetical protein